MLSCSNLDVEKTTALIGDIYDAALDASLWPEVLGKVRDYVVGSGAALFSKDVSSRGGNVYYDDGSMSPHYKQIYFEKYVKLDPASTGHYFADLEQPVSTVDLLPYEEFVETRFYKEWAQPQGLVDFVSAPLEKSPTSVAMFGVFRKERDGLVDDETRRRMRLIAPHVRRAVLIGRVIELKAAEANASADVLDGIRAGMFLVDEAARIVHANVSGFAMLTEGAVLRAVAGKLVANEPAAQQALSETFAAAGNGDAAVGTKGIAIPLSARDGTQYVCHVLPLTSGARRRSSRAYAAVAGLFVQRAIFEDRSPPELIARVHRLTPSELRVLLAVVQVGSVSETAEVLGLSEATVKTHLHRVFGKTGTSRQADLVKLVAGFSSPLA